MAIRVNLLIGCTASGKGQIAWALARRHDGEILSIDSMKIYRRMDIGTAKPSADARAEIPCHLIDVVEPSDSFSLGRYMDMARNAIEDIAARGKPIIVVGGTMLYVQGLTAGVFEGVSADPDFRRKLRGRAQLEGTQVLHAELATIDPAAAARIHANDLRRIERALEVFHVAGVPISELQTQWTQPKTPYDCRLAALRHPKEETSRRINARVKKMMEAGLVEEVRSLLAEPAGIGKEATQAVGYAEIIAHLRNEMSLEDSIERIKINSRRLAKHQRTWMRRITGVQWVDIAENETTESLADRVWDTWAQERSSDGGSEGV